MSSIYVLHIIMVTDGPMATLWDLPVELSITHEVRAAQAEVQEGADLCQESLYL